MSATDQLERILYVLALAAREDGVSYDELSRALNVDRKTIVRDLEEAITGVYNHPAGSVEPFTITLEEDRVTVFAAKEFCRPVRLTEREAMAVGLGLRLLASDANAERRAEILALAARLENELAVPEVTIPYRVSVGEDDQRMVFAEAVENGNVCEVYYMKPLGAPQTRRIAPKKLIYAKGKWYLAGRDVDRNEDRVFRLDRVLSVTETEEQFDLAAVAESTSFYAAEEQSEVEARVRYTGDAAKWIAEKANQQLETDGSAVVVHRVADVDWLVRHVLHYGGEAVVETDELKAAVAQAAERLV